MRVELTESSGPASEKKSKVSTELLFFIAINVIAVPLSGYQTYLGYQEVASSWVVAAALATLCGVLFAAMNIEIRRRRIAGEPHLTQVLFYLIPLALAFFGNFNAFYSQMMKNQLYDNAIVDYENALNSAVVEAYSKFDSVTGLTAIEATMNAELSNLRAEYLGINGQSGWQGRCEQKWKDIRDFLESKHPNRVKMGSFNSNISESKKLERADSLAKYYFKNALSTSLKSSISSDKMFMDSISSLVLINIASARKTGSLDEDGKNLLDELVKANNLIVGRMQSRFSDYKSQRVDPSQDTQIGTIKHSINSAFIDWDSPSATFFSIVLSVILDGVGLMFIMVFIPFNNHMGRPRINSGPQTL